MYYFIFVAQEYARGLDEFSDSGTLISLQSVIQDVVISSFHVDIM